MAILVVCGVCGFHVVFLKNHIIHINQLLNLFCGAIRVLFRVNEKKFFTLPLQHPPKAPQIEYSLYIPMILIDFKSTTQTPQMRKYATNKLHMGST